MKGERRSGKEKIRSIEELRREIPEILGKMKDPGFSVEDFTSQDFKAYGNLSTMSDSEWQAYERSVVEAWLTAREDIRAKGEELPSDKFPRNKVRNFLNGLRRQIKQ